MRSKSKSSSRTTKHKCFDPYCPECGPFSKSRPPPEPEQTPEEMYPTWTESTTDVIAFKRGVFYNSQKAANTWAKENLPTVHQTCHTALYFAWRVPKGQKYKLPKNAGPRTS